MVNNSNAQDQLTRTLKRAYEIARAWGVPSEADAIRALLIAGGETVPNLPPFGKPNLMPEIE